MGESWLDIETPTGDGRWPLAQGLTRVGGAGCDVVLAGAPGGELHFWDEPPKLVFVGAAGRPRLNGVEVGEAPLAAGDRIEWGEVRLRYQESAAPVLVEEPVTPQPPGAWVAPPPAAPIAAPVPAPAPAPPPHAVPGGAAGAADRAWARVQAGMAVELGLADRRGAARWQEAVVRREFDADACARDLLAGGTVGADDPRLLDRAGRLLRDFLMTSATRGIRGASRRARTQVRSGAAMIVAQAITIGIYTALLLVIMLLCRIKWGWSYDLLFDRVTGR